MSSYLKIILTAFLSAIGGSLATYFMAMPKKRREKQEQQKKELENIKEGVQAILRSQIQSQYSLMIHRGYAKPYEHQNLSYLYESYKKLGGNSYIENLYKQTLNLQVHYESEEEKERHQRYRNEGE